MGSNESPLTKLQRHYWTAKQLIRSKLGKKEDEHLVASDADFDHDLSLFKNIQDTTRVILINLEHYHHNLTELIETEQMLGDLMFQQALSEKKHLAEVMNTFANSEHQCAKFRFRLREPLTKFYHDMDKFYDRAVTDCATTVEAGEKARRDYRGSLLWMKKMSDELNPEFEESVEKYRTAQNVVRQNKEKLDKLKEDTSAKVDVLKSSRTSLLTDVIEKYVNAVEEIYENGSKVYEEALSSLSDDIDTYEIDILKILSDPVSVVTQETDEQGRTIKKRVNRPKERAQPIQKRFQSPRPDSSAVQHHKAIKSEAEGIEVAQEADDIIRVESPLGILDLEDEPHSEISSDTPEDVTKIPSFPEKLLEIDQVPPKIEPPEGWKPPTPPLETPSGIPVKHATGEGGSNFFPSEFLNPAPEKFWNPFKLLDGKKSDFMPSSLIDQPQLLASKTAPKNAKSGGPSRTIEEWDNILLDLDPLSGGSSSSNVNYNA